ncbi:MAG: ATPase, T2SS/T4P/T4SS family [Candidatus Buchananbacteria bacterium]
MLNQHHLSKIIVQAKIVTEDKLKELETEAQKRQQSLEDYIISQKMISEEALYETAAKYYQVPFINLKNQVIRKDILFLVPDIVAQNQQIVAFEADNKNISLATLDPVNLEIFEFIKKKANLEPKIYLTTPESIKEVIKQYHKGLQAEFKDLAKEEEVATLSEKGAKDLKQLAEDLPVVRIVDTLLEYAILEGASDIHIEPAEKEINVRYRVDGILRNVMTLPKTVQSGVIARIKILSNLKIDEHRLPQDGRFKVQTNEYKISFRVSIIPTFEGEKVVLRLLNEQARILTLEQLGLQTKSLEVVKRNITKPHGIILVTGPTGSGKTTTLYTVLNLLNTPQVNISTVEDPIEYRMNGVNQSQVNPRIGYTFALGLRALMRQDPNIIMVGEIRDTETADIAINAAMTGHLVLSTFHTNDAATALPRLLDMGIPSFLIASTINIIVAQRLVRKVCQNCLESYNLDKKSATEITQEFDIPSLIKMLEKEKLASSKQTLETMLFYRGKGCKQCNNEGFKGRLGIYEVLEITPEISDLILKRGSSDEIRNKAIEQGMLTLLHDGFIKAKTGLTTIEEVLRVSKE